MYVSSIKVLNYSIFLVNPAASMSSMYMYSIFLLSLKTYCTYSIHMSGAEHRFMIVFYTITFRVKTDGVDEAAVALELLQQLSVHIVHVQPPHAHQGVEAPRHHQVLGRGPVLSAVHEGRVGQHLLGRRLEPLHVPLSDGGESKRPFKSRVSNTRPAGRIRHARSFYVVAPDGLKDIQSPFLQEI